MKDPYFLVHRIGIEDGVAIVDGRTGDTEIPIGFAFSRVFQDSNAWRQKKEFHACSLVLRKIEAYGHSLDHLDPGLTARLRLEGRDYERILDGAVIE
jgi:hypothetical protein